MKLLYLHGLYSKPGGVKPAFLGRHGYSVSNPALPDDDFAASVRIAQAAFEESRPAVIVGSSRGGAVALSLDPGPDPSPLVLIAPAWRRWGMATSLKAPAIILHSEQDTVIPIADSRELVGRSGRSDATLVVVGADHNMTDRPALEALLTAIESAARSRP
jgi:alpha-beta hydrolase superfamily lysophospholipase